MVGETGTGKTVNIAQYLQGRTKVNGNAINEKCVGLTLTFSAQTTANQVQDTIDGKLEKRRRGVYGPPAGRRYITYVDDLNMPVREEYGAQPPIEILRQWFDQDGWYVSTRRCCVLPLLLLTNSLASPGTTEPTSGSEKSSTSPSCAAWARPGAAGRSSPTGSCGTSTS